MTGYHDLGHHKDPAKIILSSSQLFPDFVQTFGAGSPRHFYKTFVEGELPAKTAAMIGGQLFHLVLLEGWKLFDIDTVSADDALASELLQATVIGPLEFRILAPPGHTWNTGDDEPGLLIPIIPSTPKPSSAAGKEWFAKLVEMVYNEADVDLVTTLTDAGYPTATEVNTELDAALAYVEYLETDQAPSTIAAANLIKLTKVLGQVEQVHRASYNDVELRAKTDLLAAGGSIIDLKRTVRAHPRDFRPEDHRCRLAFYEYCIACDACEGTGEVNHIDPEELPVDCPACARAGHGAARPWEVIAVHPKSFETFVHRFSDAQQQQGRHEFHEAMALYQECLETNLWVRPAELVAVHETRPPKHWMTDDDDGPKEDDDDEFHDDDTPY